MEMHLQDRAPERFATPHRLLAWALQIVLLASAVVTQAQSSSTTRVGLKGGVNLASFYGDAVGNVDRRVGGIGGAFIGLRFNETWEFEVEMLLSQKGADQRDAAQIGEQTIARNVRWRFDYVDVPFLVVRHLSLWEDGSLRLFAGPALSVLSTAVVTGDNGRIDIEDTSKASDTVFLFGVGAERAFGVAILQADMRYTIGFDSVDDLPLSESFQRKNHAFSIMLGVAVDLRR